MRLDAIYETDQGATSNIKEVREQQAPSRVSSRLLNLTSVECMTIKYTRAVSLRCPKLHDIATCSFYLKIPEVSWFLE
jgi:hypothetical protein